MSVNPDPLSTYRHKKGGGEGRVLLATIIIIYLQGSKDLSQF